jgi:hypothetical protein
MAETIDSGQERCAGAAWRAIIRARSPGRAAGGRRRVRDLLLWYAVACVLFLLLWFLVLPPRR